MSTLQTDQLQTLDGQNTHDVANMGIESGSNANGDYTKFPDGTMICTRSVDYVNFDITNSVGDLYMSIAIGDPDGDGYEFPQPFIEKPAFSFSLHAGSGGSNTWVMSGLAALAPLERWDFVKFVTPTSKSGIFNATLNLQAIGRWK